MNILRLVYEWPPPWHGLVAGPFEISVAQAARGHQIRFVCGGWPRRAIFPAAGVDVRRLPAALPGLNLFATTAPLALLAAWRGSRWADVIHGHQHLPVWYHTARAALNLQQPYVLHLHITAAGRAAQAARQATRLDFWTRFFEWPLHAYADRIGCRTADAVICVSESVRAEAIRYYHAPPERLHVISNGVNTARFHPEGDDRRRQLGLSSADRVVLSVGSLSTRKRPGLLLEALTHLPDGWKLLFVGDGPLGESLRRTAAARGLTERVFFLGGIPYPELPAYYRTADVFALTAAYEGFPKVILEALASGVPIVTTPSFEIDEPLTPYVSLVEEATPAAIAGSIAGAYGREIDLELIDTRYSWRAKIARIEEVYDAIR